MNTRAWSQRESVARLSTVPVRPPGRAAAARDALTAACRRDSGVIIAVLTRALGSIDSAEDVLQSAFERALEDWPRRGVPTNPGAWLTTVARRIAIDAIRRRDAASRARADIITQRRSGFDPVTGRAEQDLDDPYDVLDRWPDERLKLIFLCCHPSLTPRERLALTLREVCGLTTAAIARAFLISETAMAQRLVRAKRSLRDSDADLTVPQEDDFPSRLADVLLVIYLLFNEGYLASGGNTLSRPELCEEAINLGRTVLKLIEGEHTECEPEIMGLLALMVLTHSRRFARVDQDGISVPLEDQDRSRWIHEEAREGIAILDDALAAGRPGAFQIKAAIAAVHHTATNAGETDWRQIHALYETLYLLEPSPVVRLNQVVALGMWRGPEAGLRVLEGLPASEGKALAGYVYYHLARARFLRDVGRTDEHVAALERALEVSRNGAERRFIESRLIAP